MRSRARRLRRLVLRGRPGSNAPLHLSRSIAVGTAFHGLSHDPIAMPAGTLPAVYDVAPDPRFSQTITQRTPHAGLPHKPVAVSASAHRAVEDQTDVGSPSGAFAVRATPSVFALREPAAIPTAATWTIADETVSNVNEVEYLFHWLCTFVSARPPSVVALVPRKASTTAFRDLDSGLISPEAAYVLGVLFNSFRKLRQEVHRPPSSVVEIIVNSGPRDVNAAVRRFDSVCSRYRPILVRSGHPGARLHRASRCG